MELVSVIIPTYNRKPLLKRALKSVFAQKNVDFEVFVSDDGSTDGTEAMIQDEFPFVEYLRQENQGPSAARNRAIERTKGDWLAFLDSDDAWLPGKLEAQTDFFRRNPEYRICQTEESWIRNGRHVNPMKKHKKYGGFIFQKCLPLCIVSPSAVLMQRSLLEDMGGFDESLPACEDYDLWLRIAAQNPIGLIEKSYVLKYGGHADQRSHEFPAMDRFRIYALRKILGSGALTVEQTEAAKNILQKKTEIYIRGAQKRERPIPLGFLP